MRTSKVKQKLTLYIHSKSPLSKNALRNLKEISKRSAFKKKYDLCVVEIDNHPETTEKMNILATPLLIYTLNNTERRVLGDLSDLDRVYEELNLEEKSWIMTINNITESKEQEAKLDIAAGVFRSSIDSIMITDINGMIVSVNKGFEEVMGYKKEEVIGKNVNIIKSGKQSPGFYKKMFEHLRKTGSWRGEIWAMFTGGVFAIHTGS